MSPDVTTGTRSEGPGSGSAGGSDDSPAADGRSDGITETDDRSETDDRYRAELRAVARRLHPDLGGDPATYLAAVEAVDRAHGRGPGTRGPGAHGGTRGGTRGGTPAGPDDGHRGRAARTSVLRRRLRRARRAVRARLPRRFPGARRYAHL